MAGPPLSFRPARRDDLDRLAAIHTSAYPTSRSHAARVKNFTDNPFGALEDLWVLEDGATLLAHGFLFPLQAWFGGARVRVGGIATLGVAPEARGRGLGSRLMDHLHDVAASRGDAVTILYPFRQGFYSRLGYAPTSPYRRLRFSPAAIPWKLDLSLRLASGADRGAMRSCWEAAAIARTGTLVRPDRAWDFRLLDERRTWIVVEGGDGVEGYAAWTVEQREAHAETTLLVHEMAASSDAAIRALWAAVGTQRDQVTEVRVDVSEDDPIDRGLVDGDRARSGDARAEHLLGEVVGGPMVRVVEPSRALAARGWGGAGTIVLGVANERLELRVTDGRAVVSPAAAEPDVRLAPAALAAVAFGALRPSHAARLGWLAARDDRSVALADALFALPPYFSPDPF